MNTFWFPLDTRQRSGAGTADGCGWAVQGAAVGMQPHMYPTLSHCLHQPAARPCWAQKPTQPFQRVLQSTCRGVWCRCVPHSPDVGWDRSPPCCSPCAGQKALRMLHFTGAVQPLCMSCLLSPSEHPPFPSLTGSWNSASHSRLLWALSLCQAVQQEPR